MTLLAKGFIINKALENNVYGEVSTVGELSTFSRTFSKDISSVTDNDYPGVEVALFDVVRQETNQRAQVPQEYNSLLCEFTSWLYQTALVSFNSGTREIDVVAAIQNRFEANVGQITVDPLINNGILYMPTRVAMVFALPGLESVSVIFWSSDNYFRVGYDSYEVDIVTPVDNMDVFLGNYETVMETLNNLDPILTQNRIDTVVDKKPATSIMPVVVEWVDQVVTDRVARVVFYAVVHGPAGTDTDIINNKIKEKILASSSGTEANWRLVMPDIFRITRFLFVPGWEYLAIPGRSNSVGIYSPMLKKTEFEGLINSIMAVDSELNIEDWEVVPHPYRSLTMVALAGLDNKEQARSISHLYGDYIAAESTHEDYNRQSKATIDFCNMLGTLIRDAERYNVGVQLPNGFRVANFLDKRCIATKLGTTEFLMVTKNQPVRV